MTPGAILILVEPDQWYSFLTLLQLVGSTATAPQVGPRVHSGPLVQPVAVMVQLVPNVQNPPPVQDVPPVHEVPTVQAPSAEVQA